MIFSKIDRFLFHSFSLGPPSRLVWTVINVGPRDDRMAIRPVLEERFDRLLTGAHDDNVHFLDQPGFPFSSLTGHLWAHNCVLEERPTVDARPRMTADRSRERKGSSGWIKEEKRKWKQYERSRSLSFSFFLILGSAGLKRLRDKKMSRNGMLLKSRSTIDSMFAELTSSVSQD